jgi:dTDP-4-amino-4,6-dideoxygalactose transaminase
MRASLQAKMKEVGIPTMVYYPTPMSMQTAFKGQHTYIDTPNARRLSQCVLSLPMHPYLTDEDIQKVVKMLLTNLKAQ